MESFHEASRRVKLGERDEIGKRLSGEREVRDRLFQAFDEQAKRIGTTSLAPSN